MFVKPKPVGLLPAPSLPFRRMVVNKMRIVTALSLTPPLAIITLARVFASQESWCTHRQAASMAGSTAQSSFRATHLTDHLFVVPSNSAHAGAPFRRLRTMSTALTL